MFQSGWNKAPRWAPEETMRKGRVQPSQLGLLDWQTNHARKAVATQEWVGQLPRPWELKMSSALDQGDDGKSILGNQGRPSAAARNILSSPRRPPAAPSWRTARLRNKGKLRAGFMSPATTNIHTLSLFVTQLCGACTKSCKGTPTWLFSRNGAV